MAIIKLDSLDMREWQLQEAKNKLSQLVSEVDEGPQTITVHGRPRAVVLSMDEYRRLAKAEGSLVDFFLASPLRGEELELERSKDTGRDVPL